MSDQQVSNASQPFNVITLTIPATEATNYCEVYQVEPRYLAQTLRLAGSFQGAIEPDDLNFNFEAALSIAQGIPNSAVVKTLNQSVIQQTIQVSVMVDQLKELVRTVLGISISSPTFWGQVTSALTNVFTNLAAQEDAAWLFWKSESSSNTSYYYNLLFAVQNAETGGVMAILPLAFEVNVAVHKERLLFFTLQDTARYEVRAKAVTLVQQLEHLAG
ncbi:hypothetical protein AB0L75_41375 [Streptomyces sp. NPDC052101]|uniref:hypothetical protein n=1 Tax=Streptomyces sp. NPDC052101 TaxID=3155763 RepID=UPI00342ACD39